MRPQHPYIFHPIVILFLYSAINFIIHSNMISCHASQVFSSRVINLKSYLQDIFQYDIFNLMFIYFRFYVNFLLCINKTRNICFMEKSFIIIILIIQFLIFYRFKYEIKIISITINQSGS